MVPPFPSFPRPDRSSCRGPGAAHGGPRGLLPRWGAPRRPIIPGSGPVQPPADALPPAVGPALQAAAIASSPLLLSWGCILLPRPVALCLPPLESPPGQPAAFCPEPCSCPPPNQPETRETAFHYLYGDRAVQCVFAKKSSHIQHLQCLACGFVMSLAMNDPCRIPDASNWWLVLLF